MRVRPKTDVTPAWMRSRNGRDYRGTLALKSSY
jgi:hypothetical protein